MNTWTVSLFAIASLAHAGTVIDQIAVTVGRHAIKTSDIDRDLRVTQFLNSQAPDISPTQRRIAIQRLIDQELIRNELAQAGSTSSLTSEAKELLDMIRAERFHGSDAEMAAELRRRGLSEDVLLEAVQWQLTVLRFIDQRFRLGIVVTDDDIGAYYKQHEAELKRQYPGNDTLEALTPRIRELLEGERINRAFEDWLQQARKNARIEFKLSELTG